MTEESAGDDETINIRGLIRPLDPNTLGRLEPLSGLMRLNVAQADFAAASGRWAANACTAEDVDMIRTLNHETYHGFQAAASGYVFHRQQRLFAVFNAFEPPEPPQLRPDVAQSLATLRAAAGDDPVLIARADRAEALVRIEGTLQMWNEAALPGDNSLFGVMHPAFFRFQDALVAQEAVRNARGLSIRGLMEGSAVAYSHLVMHPKGGGEAAMLTELTSLPAIYHELYDVTLAQAGPRAMELLLPATALAFCYAAPQEAYRPVLEMLLASEPGTAVAAGRTLLEALPDIPAAGAILHDAVALRQVDDSYRIYDIFIGHLSARSWGVDSYDLLADPSASDKLRGMPFALVTNDDMQAINGSMSQDEMGGRMVIMAFALRIGTRRLAEMAARQWELAWMQDVINFNMSR